jgi:hypothetical protein
MARLSPAGTSKGNALRFSPTTSSMSGTSASGKRPAEPSADEGCSTFMRASRKSFGAPILPGPAASPWSSDAEAETPVAGPVTMTWKASNSFFAAVIAAPRSARGASSGRIFSLATAVQTVPARAPAGRLPVSAARVRAARRVVSKSAPFGWVDFDSPND